MGIFQKLFGTHSERELKLIYPIVDKIEALRPDMIGMTDDELRAKTREFKQRLAKGETLESYYIRDVSQRCVPVKERR